MQFSIWEKESFFQQQDIIIIGSGLVGLWSAIFLKEKYPSLSVTIVERGMIPSGASGRNAGFACFGSVSELIADVDKMGADQMWQLVEMRYKGLQQIIARFPSEATGYEYEGGYEVFTPEQQQLAEKCFAAIDEMNRGMKSVTGEDDAFRLNNSHISRFGFAGFNHLIENRLEAQLHSGKLLQSLIRTAVGAGVQILTGINISEINPSGTCVEMRASVSSSHYTSEKSETNRSDNSSPSNTITSRSVTGSTRATHLTNAIGQPHEHSGAKRTKSEEEIVLSARKVLVCTNGFAKQLLPKIDVVPARGQVVVTTPVDGLPFKGCFHYDEGFYYFRNLDNRVLLGGGRNLAFEEETTTEMVTTSLIQESLENFLRTNILPTQSFRIEHRWSGIMGMSQHSGKLPVIRDLGDGLYCCVRMSGMGVALAPEVAGQVIKLLE